MNSDVIEGTNIVTATYAGPQGADESDALQASLDSVIAAHGNARLLLELGDVDPGRVEPEAVWKTLKTTGKLEDVDRAALVTDAGWADKLGSLLNKVAPFELAVYATGRRDEAVAWLSS